MEVRVVAEESGEPLAGASLSGRVGEERETRVTDADGRTAVVLPPEAVRLELRIEAPGRVPVRAVWAAADAAPGALPATSEARLPAGVAVSGRVTAAGGEPVAGAEVEVTRTPAATTTGPWAEALTGTTLRTDADGRWSSDAFPANLAGVRLEVRHPSYRTRTGLVPGSEALDTVLPEPIQLTGTAVDGAGRPVPFASVHAGGGLFFHDWSGVAADARGRFSLPRTAPGELWLLVEAEGSAPAKRELEVGADGFDAGEVELGPGFPVGGRVVDADGEPRPGVRVWQSSWDRHQLLDWETTTDADGRWRWEHAPRSDAVGFSLSAEGLSRVSLTLAPGKPGSNGQPGLFGEPGPTGHPDPDVVMRPAIEVSGRVTDADTGEPIEAFSVLPAFHFRPEDDRRTRIEHEREAFRGGGYRVTLDHPYDRVAVDVEAEGYEPAASPAYRVAGERRGFTFDAALRRDAGRRGAARTRATSCGGWRWRAPSPSPPTDEPVGDEPLELGDLPVTIFPENLPPPKPAADAPRAVAPRRARRRTRSRPGRPADRPAPGLDRPADRGRPARRRPLRARRAPATASWCWTSGPRGVGRACKRCPSWRRSTRRRRPAASPSSA